MAGVELSDGAMFVVALSIEGVACWFSAAISQKFLTFKDKQWKTFVQFLVASLYPISSRATGFTGSLYDSECIRSLYTL